MRVAYLVNRYPTVSHSFIRREIAALERRGVEVRRYSLRAPDGALPDPLDQSEAAATRAVLAQSKLSLVFAAVREMVAYPRRLCRCLGGVLGMVPSGDHRWMRTLAYVIEGCWLAGALRRDRAHHLHAHFGTNSATVARIAARLAGVPYSFTAHGPEEFDAPQALGLATKVRDAAFVVAISSFGRSQLLRLLAPEAWMKVHIVRCGLEFGNDAAPDRASIETAYDFCFVGRLAPQKGLPTLAESLALLSTRGQRVSVCMIGDGELQAWFCAYLEQHGLANAVDLRGAQSERAVFDAMRRSKAVIVPSYAEGLPVVLMEALANRRPVVTTYVAGIPELVTPECGILVPAGDAHALADALGSVRGLSVKEREAMGTVGYDRVRRFHDIERSAEQLHALFCDAAQQRTET
jgi:colanic acid/amylovoran biosynthesis glycosyltransferase